METPKNSAAAKLISLVGGLLIIFLHFFSKLKKEGFAILSSS